MCPGTSSWVDDWDFSGPQAIRVSQMSWSSSSCRVLSTWRMLRWDVNLFRRSKGIESDRTWYGALKLGSLESECMLHSLHRWFSSCIRPWVCKLDWSNGVSSAGMLTRYSAALICFTWQGRLQIGWAASWNSGDWQRRPVDLGQTGSDVLGKETAGGNFLSQYLLRLWFKNNDRTGFLEPTLSCFFTVQATSPWTTALDVCTARCRS